MAERYVAADPYPWPFNGDLRPENTALIVIDMQIDFCGIGGYVDRMGYDLSLTRTPIPPIAAVLDAMRRRGFHVFHTREGRRPGPRRFTREQALAFAADRAGIGDPGPCGRILRGQSPKDEHLAGFASPLMLRDQGLARKMLWFGTGVPFDAGNEFFNS